MKASASRIQVYFDYINEIIDLDEAIKRLTQPSEPSEAMYIGTLIHGLLEKITPQTLNDCDFVSIDKYTLAVNDCLKDVVKQTAFPHKLVEYKLSKEYPYKGDIITLSGIADAIIGNNLIEYKTTSHIDIERYYNSPQWKIYFDLFNADRIEYHIMKLKVKERQIEIVEYAQLNMYDYIGRSDEVRNTLYEFYDFVKSLGIELYTNDHTKR